MSKLMTPQERIEQKDREAKVANDRQWEELAERFEARDRAFEEM